jgi:hypothetical protein
LLTLRKILFKVLRAYKDFFIVLYTGLYLFIYFVGLKFELRASRFKADTLLLEPHLQPIFDTLILEMGSHELFAWAGVEPRSS